MSHDPNKGERHTIQVDYDRTISATTAGQPDIKNILTQKRNYPNILRLKYRSTTVYLQQLHYVSERPTYASKENLE